MDPEVDESKVASRVQALNQSSKLDTLQEDCEMTAANQSVNPVVDNGPGRRLEEIVRKMEAAKKQHEELCRLFDEAQNANSRDRSSVGARNSDVEDPVLNRKRPNDEEDESISKRRRVVDPSDRDFSGKSDVNGKEEKSDAKTKNEWNKFELLKTPSLGTEYNIEPINSDANGELSQVYSPHKVRSRSNSIVDKNDDVVSTTSNDYSVKRCFVKLTRRAVPNIDAVDDDEEPIDNAEEVVAENMSEQTLDTTAGRRSQSPMLTRAIRKIKNYDDRDEAQNELIAIERIEVSTVVHASATASMSPEKLHDQWTQQCIQYGFPAPLSLQLFEMTDWRHVSKYNDSMLEEGYKFKTNDDLSQLKRRHPKFAFCHPGPLFDDETKTHNWYYADSVVQEVKLRSQTGVKLYFVVRWVGYEDAFNTLELERDIKNTAIWKLHKLEKYATAARSSGAILLRRSHRLLNNEIAPILALHPEAVRSEKYLRAMKLLHAYLNLQKSKDLYHDEVGFVSKDSDVLSALRHQFNFISKSFLPIMSDMNCSGFHMSPKYLGSLFGKNRSKKLNDFEVKPINFQPTITKEISAGLSAAKKTTSEGDDHFVSFFVFAKHSDDETEFDKHLDMHVCVYTVRSKNKIRDVVYYDPSPLSHRHHIPDCITKLLYPKIRSITRVYGHASQYEDCIYQCFKYIIALHSGEISFGCSY